MALRISEMSAYLSVSATGTWSHVTVASARIAATGLLQIAHHIFYDYDDALHACWDIYDHAGVRQLRVEDWTNGVATIAMALDGGDVDYTCQCPVGSYSGAIVGGASSPPSTVKLDVARSTAVADGSASSTIDYVNIVHGITTQYPWDNAAELDDWTITGEALVSGGLLYSTATGGATLVQAFAYEAPSGKAITSALSAPGVQRIVAVAGSNGLQDRYASGALADILTGSLADNHPELVHVGAGGHHLGLVWQRSNDICITTGTGVPGITGWPNTVQTVALARSKPTACVIDPTHDIGVAYLNGTDALFSPAAWANGSYVMGTETLIANDAADERGQLLQSPDGYLLYIYRDSGGAVAIKRSANRGITWS